jgi:hypothetical protein
MVVHTHVIPAVGRLRQEDHKFKASLGYVMRLCLKNKQANKLKQLDMRRKIM